MTISLLRHITGAGKDSATSSAGIDTTGASLLVMNVGWQSGVTVTVSDNKGNTWQALTNQASSPIQGQIFYAWNPSVGTGHTFTITGTGGYISFELAAFSGVLTTSNPFDVQSVGYAGAVSSAGIGAQNLTPTSDNSLVINGLIFNGSISGLTPLAGFSAVDAVNQGAGANYGSAMDYLVQTTKATVSNATTTAQWTGAVPTIANSAVFKYDPNYAAAPATVTSVGVTPNPVTVQGGGTQTFTATVSGTNSPSQSVTWSTNGGSITTGGVFTAPAATASVQTITITATSVADGTKSGTATVTVPAVGSPTVTSVAVSPSTANVAGGGTQTFTATVSGTNSPATTVTWTTTGGSITTGGVFTAPAATASAQTITVTATSTADTSKSGTATVTVPGTVAGPITPATSGKSYKPMTRTVGNTSAPAGTGTATLAGTTIAGCRTLAAAYVTATSRIPYVMETSDKSQWESGLGSFNPGSPATFSRDQVFASSNAGSLVNFTNNCSVYCDIPAEVFSTLAIKDFIDLRDFDVDPTFTTDSTAGIQAAIQKAWDTRTSKIKCPDGRFMIAGAPSVSSAQLWIPNSKSTDQSRTIIFEGSAPPNLELQGLISMPVTTNGTIFESTLAPTTGASLLRGEAGMVGDAGGKWNYTNVGFRNMGFRTKVDSGANPMVALNLDYFSQIVDLNNLRIDVNMPLYSCPDPSSVNSSGIILPPTDNHANFQLTGVTLIGGYTNGVVASEHLQMNKLSTVACTNALVLNDTNHASVVSHLHVECCKNSILLNGNHPCTILGYSAEHYTNTDHWYTFASDIKFTGTGANSSGGSAPRKVVIVQATTVVSSVGTYDAFTVINPTTAAIHRVLVGAGANAGLV